VTEGSELTDTTRVNAGPIEKRAPADAHAGVATKRSAPNPVATPRPPRPRSVTGQQCPDTTATAAMASASGRKADPGGSRNCAKTTAAEPFTMSSTATSKPAPVPSVRKVFVAPVEPDPTVRRSTLR